MPTQDERIRDLEHRVQQQDTAQQVHETEDRLLYTFIRDSLIRIEAKVDKLEQRADAHSDEGSPPTTSPGIENHPTQPGEPHKRWDPPSMMQIGGWAAAIGTAVTTITAAITTGVVLGYRATVAEVPPAPTASPVELAAPMDADQTAP